MKLFFRAFRIYIPTFILSVLGVYAYTQEKVDSDKVYSLNEITVVKRIKNQNISSAAPTQVFNSEQLQHLNVSQVSDALKFFSGVTVKDYGGIGGLKTVSVRGLGATHTAVSYDGIALTDCQSGQIDINRYSIDNVDFISLNNGQGDNIFQPARNFSLASLLSIRTLKPLFNKNKVFNTKLSFKSGSFGLINPTFVLEQKISKKYSAGLNCEWLSTNGEYPYLLQKSYEGNGITSKEIRRNSDVQNIRLEGSLYAEYSALMSAYIKFYYYNSERGLPGATILYNESAFSSQRLWDNTFFAQAHFEQQLTKLLTFQTNAKYNRGFLHYRDNAVLNNAGFEESRFYQNEYYVSLSAQLKASDHLSLVVSSDGSVNNLSVTYENPILTADFAKPVRRSLLSVIAAKYITENTLATASLLSTVVSETTQNGPTAKSQNRLSPFISITYKPLKQTDFRIRAFYKNIFRLPSFNDLYYSRIGNVNLRPEITNQYNLGITFGLAPTHPLSSFFFLMDVYKNRITDKIIATPTKNLFNWSMINLGKVEIYGTDLTTEATLKVGKKSEIDIGCTYTYQRAFDITNSEEVTFKHQLPYIPRVSGSGKLAIKTPYIDIAYTVLWSGKRYILLQNYAENRLPAYSDHSISASRKFKIKNKILYLNIEMLNLFNENYAIVKWFPMPGRSFRSTLSLKF